MEGTEVVSQQSIYTPFPKSLYRQALYLPRGGGSGGGSVAESDVDLDADIACKGDVARIDIVPVIA